MMFFVCEFVGGEMALLPETWSRFTKNLTTNLKRSSMLSE